MPTTNQRTLVSLTASTIRVVDGKPAQEVNTFEVTRTPEGLDIYRSVGCSCDGGCLVCEGNGRFSEESYTIADNAETLAWARREVARMSSAGWVTHTLVNGFKLTELAS